MLPINEVKGRALVKNLETILEYMNMTLENNKTTIPEQEKCATYRIV